MRVVHRAGAKPVAPRLRTLRRGGAVFPAPQGRVGGIGGAHTGLRASEAFKHPLTAERPGGPDTLPYDSVVPTPWFRELRQLHDENFREDWTSHVSALNRELGLTGPDAFGVPARGLPPPWFVGDVEAVPPRQWVLVISLNQARREENEEWHLAQRYTEQTYWDPWGANIPSAGQAALRRPVGPSRARSSEASIARLGRTKRSEDPADMTKSARTKGIAVFV